MTKKVEDVQFEFECRFEAEVVKGDLHHHQVIPTDPIHSPGRQKASRRYTQYLDITCLLINLKAMAVREQFWIRKLDTVRSGLNTYRTS